MFSFFKKKSPPAPAPIDLKPEDTAALPLPEQATPVEPAPDSAPPAEPPETLSAAPEDPTLALPPDPEAEPPAVEAPAEKPVETPKASSGIFSFFRKKAPPAPPPPSVEETPVAPTSVSVPAALPEADVETAEEPAPSPLAPTAPAIEAAAPKAPAPLNPLPPSVAPVPPRAPPPATPAPPAPSIEVAPSKASAPLKPSPPAVAPRLPVAPPPTAAPAPASVSEPVPVPMPVVPTVANAVDKPVDKPMAANETRKGWLDRLKAGLRRTGAGIATVFTGTQIDDALYEELEDALLMADTGVKATEHLLIDLKKRVKEAKATNPADVKGLLADAIVALLEPLQKTLVIGEFKPTVIMVAGVNGAGKTTSIGKLTRHLANEGASVLLAAADTFRAAAREQLAVWADRNTVEIVTQEGGDPAAVSFDAVTAGRARGRDVVLVDTAGRLPTQLHLMDELKKIKRVVQKADPTAPHEVLLVIDGNTGQNALAQVKAFDDILGLTGLVITKLDGTAKGGVICAIAREKPIPIYFIGVGEKLEDLETFNAREFAQALLA